MIRPVGDHPESAYEFLQRAGFAFCEVDLLGVEVPDKPQPLLLILSTLLQAEVNINYSFPLLVNPNGRPALGIAVDDFEMAAKVLDTSGFTLLTENDLENSSS